MRLGVVVSLALGVCWALLAILQLWMSIFPIETFLKVTVTFGILIGIILLVTLVVGESHKDKELKEKGYIDS